MAGPTEPTPSTRDASATPGSAASATAADTAPAAVPDPAARMPADGPRLLALGGTRPDIADDAFVAAGATVIGEVTLAAGSSVWYGAVLRGDAAAISIGEQSNVQDGSVVHADPGYPAVVGARVTVGHGVVIHGCRIDDDVLVGMGAVIMNGAHIGSHSLIAAGAVVTQGTEVPEASLVAGVPAKVIREVGGAERELIATGHRHYVERARLHATATPA